MILRLPAVDDARLGLSGFSQKLFHPRRVLFTHPTIRVESRKHSGLVSNPQALSAQRQLGQPRHGAGVVKRDARRCKLPDTARSAPAGVNGYGFGSNGTVEHTETGKGCAFHQRNSPLNQIDIMQQALRVVNLPVPHLRRFVPPLIEEVIAYGKEIGLPEIEAQKLWHYYTSINWQVGKAQMKVWRSAVAGWKLRWEERTKKKILRKLEPSINVLRIEWRQEMAQIEEALKKYPQLADTRWLDSKEVWASKVKAWREPRDKLVSRKQELLRNLGRVV